jgi:ankyrin repeat protein
LISQIASSSEQLTTQKYPSAMELDATFYPTQWEFTPSSSGDESTISSLYLTASLLNNMNTTLDNAYKWLKALPRPAVSKIMEALPFPILDALRERVFALAIEVGDADVVQSMLALDVDPGDKIMWKVTTHSRTVYPFEVAMCEGHFLVAKNIISHMCKGAALSQLNELLNLVLVWEESDRRIARPNHMHRLKPSEVAELLVIILSAGADPDGRCIAAVNDSFDLVKQIFDTGTGNIRLWLKAGLLEVCLREMIHGHSNINEWFVERVMFYVFHENRHQLPTGDGNFRSILLQGLRCAVEVRRIWAIEMVLCAITGLGYEIDLDIETRSATTHAFVQAYRDADWTLAMSSIAQNISPITAQPQEHDLAISQTNEEIRQRESLQKELIRAIEQDDLRLVCSILESTDDNETLSQFLVEHDLLEELLRFCSDQMAAAITQRLQNVWDRDAAFGIILMHGRTQVVSALLRAEPEWNAALGSATGTGDFGALDNLLYTDSSSVPYVASQYGFEAIEHQQTSYRAIAYYAGETNDPALNKWLLDSGMDTDEIICSDSGSDVMFISKRPAMNGSFNRFRLPDTYKRGEYPSLLAIAAQQNNLPWIKFLLNEGADARDSMALFRAVKYRAEDTTIQLLLQEASKQKGSCKRIYGSAALRKAVRRQDFSRVSMLSDHVDIDMTESSTKDCLEDKPCISAMGDAILMGDVGMVSFLLHKGANANICVAYDGLESLKPKTGYIARVTPLLAAIDMRSLPIVKILVEHGAEIDYRRKIGIPRTPLQRAAETGGFDIVRYLVEHEALIDTVPMRSGATALQLAAMNGYVGIATFLIEHGAAPNYPPAKGDGRTAFEAAAEWGRIDMMSMLMRAGVQLDMEVGDPPESQYERALRFAEENGYAASKRYVKHLYEQMPENLRSEDAQMLGLSASPIYEMSPFNILTSPL